MINFDQLVNSKQGWLKSDGPDCEIVVSSRIRLARNLVHFPFLNYVDETVKGEIANELKPLISQITTPCQLELEDVQSLDRIERQVLVERQLISREQSEASGPRLVAISENQSTSIMINEEDHIRMQVINSGYDLESCWKDINALDDAIESQTTYAFSEQFGYMTSCPTNVGTGIRVSVMLHLPALVQTKEIQKVFQGMQKMHLAVRGSYGEGSQAMGDFYQVSNQMTLGYSESQLIKNLKEILPKVIDYERRCREALLKENRRGLQDQIARAFGILKNAHQISSRETMELLSLVRLGATLGMVDVLDLPTINKLFIQTQPAHLQKMNHETMETEERNVVRATFLRKTLHDFEQENE